MKKLALLFPGQGSQCVGMARDLYDQYPVARETIDSANDILGYDLRRLLFEGPEDALRQTRVTQPAIFTASIAAFRVFDSMYVIPTEHCLCAGHSLGEYSALCASGVFSFEDGLRLVKARGEFIQQASDENPGIMAAIIGLERAKVETVCAQAAHGEVCEPVNYNCPGQVVIAGTRGAVERAVSLATEAGAMKAIILNVSGPFHSSLMAGAAERMAGEFARYTFQQPEFNVITNCDAELTWDSVGIAEKLVRQIKSPVLWEDSMAKMVALGIDVYIEIGPQRVLSGLLRRIFKQVTCVNIEDTKSLTKTLEELKK